MAFVRVGPVWYPVLPVSCSVDSLVVVPTLAMVTPPVPPPFPSRDSFVLKIMLFGCPGTVFARVSGGGIDRLVFQLDT